MTNILSLSLKHRFFFPRSLQHQSHCSDPDTSRLSCLSSRCLRHDRNTRFEEHSLIYEILDTFHTSETPTLSQTPRTCVTLQSLLCHPEIHLPILHFPPAIGQPLFQHYRLDSIFRVLSMSSHSLHGHFL